MAVYFMKGLIMAASLFSVFSSQLNAAEVKLDEVAPAFSAKTHEGKDFNIASRKGQWTVLYFYPKADTPGCTKQACTLRDNIGKIRAEGADVFGISADTVESQAAFHSKHHLNFTLLADPEDKIIQMYGVKMPLLKMSKRWTFIIDPELIVRKIIKNVDPVKDSQKTADQIAELKKSFQK